MSSKEAYSEASCGLTDYDLALLLVMSLHLVLHLSRLVGWGRRTTASDIQTLRPFILCKGTIYIICVLFHWCLRNYANYIYVVIQVTSQNYWIAVYAKILLNVSVRLYFQLKNKNRSCKHLYHVNAEMQFSISM